MPTARRSVLMALQFWPRGGSAQVVRYLAPEIVAAGWTLSLVAGSLGGPGESGYAPEFFAPLDVQPVDYTPAVSAWRRGEDPLKQPVPMHPSFEDRPGAPDRVFAAVDDDDYERQVAVWSQALSQAGLSTNRVVHLNHLTPVNEAVQRLNPRLPLVVSLHGTEMLLLEALDRGEPGAANGRWRYGQQWADRLRRWAAQADHLVVVSPTDRARAATLFDLPRERVTVVAHGVDQERFRPEQLARPQRVALLREWLVRDPRGWDESGVVGSVRYDDAQLAAFLDPDLPVLMFVGRFTEPKRLPLLLRAYARARREHGIRAPLVIWGGHPPEWEGEHPVTLARRDRIDGVFFTGWHGHDVLPAGLRCADAFVSPSVGEAFGQVFLEAMACGLPVVAAASGGPLSFVNAMEGAPNGWLVPPDDEQALVQALVAAVTQPDERAARGENALRQVRASYSWPAAARAVVDVYDRVVSEREVAR